MRATVTVMTRWTRDERVMIFGIIISRKSESMERTMKMAPVTRLSSWNDVIFRASLSLVLATTAAHHCEESSRDEHILSIVHIEYIQSDLIALVPSLASDSNAALTTESSPMRSGVRNPTPAN